MQAHALVKTARFSFKGDLNFFLPLEHRQSPTLSLSFRGRQSLKHLIESLGVPHTEVGQALVDGQPVNLAHITQDGEQVEVWPATPGCPIEPRFLLDSHLGKLTAHLRMLGFDCQYRNDYEDAELVELAEKQNRILLTRDRRLLMRKVVRYGYCPRSLEPDQQLVEVVRRFDLRDKLQPFHRCLRCNAPLESVSKEAVLERLEPLTKKYFDEFAICRDCDQVYWKGSHYERMQRLIRRVMGA
jgi:uncharacterized protein with PIN domain